LAGRHRISHTSAATPCFFARTSTIFQCPKSALFSDTEQITFEQCFNEDVTASAYAVDPLVDGRPTITLHGVPPPKRTKRIWKKMTKSKREFSACLLELAPDTFQHHQLETVQREQLPIQVRSITKHNNIVAAWVDDPENASIVSVTVVKQITFMLALIRNFMVTGISTS